MIKTRTVIATDTFTLRPLDASEVAAIRARYHAAMNRPADARAVIAQTKERSPGGAMADIDGMLFDREGKRQEARAAYAAAVDARTRNFFAYYRLAALESVQNPDAATLARVETLLRRSTELNDRFAPAQAMLADVMTIQGRAADAIDVAKRAVALDPSQVNSRLALARALWRSSRISDARGHVLAARTLASSDQEREAVQTMLDALDRASVAEGAR
jgi:tetratricopeptide (TPR) repeat protein